MRGRHEKRLEQAAATMLCWVCGRPLDPVLVLNRYATHPTCDPYEVSPLWPPGTVRVPVP
jgi:hypothetical protein